MTDLALDLGAATTKVAREGHDSIVSPAAPGDWPDRLTRAMPGKHRQHWRRRPGNLAGRERGGDHAREALGEACAGLGLARVTWTGQLSAIAALTARQRGDGRYLIADIGATGVRVAVLDVTARWSGSWPWTARTAPGGTSSMPALRTRATGGPVPGDWYRSARDEEQDRAARAVLTRAMSSPGYRESAAYAFPGASLLAGQVIDCFAPTAQCLQHAAGRVRQDRPADVVVLAGGLGWFPLAGSALAETAGQDPVIVGPDAVPEARCCSPEGQRAWRRLRSCPRWCCRCTGSGMANSKNSACRCRGPSRSRRHPMGQSCWTSRSWPSTSAGGG